MFAANKKRVMSGRWGGIAALGVVAALILAACHETIDSTTNVSVAQEVFPTPEVAIDALADATRRDDKDALRYILGIHAEKLISSGDPVADRNGREKFLAAYDAKHQLEQKNKDIEVLVVGSEEWPLPIPLVRQEGGWIFDTAVGEQEILNRRIGRNELNVMEVCRAYVSAQKEFAEQRQNRRGHREYARKFMSSHGKHDGLYWPVRAGEKESPLGSLMAKAQAEGYRAVRGEHRPYHGYYFRILKRQGANAAGG